MSELAPVPVDERTVSVEFDETFYPRDAIYGAAYIFIDRCYVRLERPGAGRVAVRLERKPSTQATLEELVGEFQNELLGQAWRRQILDENRALLERVSARAVAGSAGPPGLDDLLQIDTSGEAFDDPLGIAMSWEDRYKKKPGDSGGGAP